jgi:hypothetical protein
MDWTGAVLAGMQSHRSLAMIFHWILFLASVAATAATLMLSGPSEVLVLAASSVLASLILLAAGFRRRRHRKAPKWVVVDGSNVMHWKDGTPRIDTVREVVDHLETRGFTPGVVFDANAGYKLDGSYHHHHEMARSLGLPEDRVMVVHKGTPADATILLAARDLGARVVSNDQFRDWTEAYPEVREPEHLIKGGYRRGKLWLALE